MTCDFCKCDRPGLLRVIGLSLQGPCRTAHSSITVQEIFALGGSRNYSLRLIRDGVVGPATGMFTMFAPTAGLQMFAA